MPARRRFTFDELRRMQATLRMRFRAGPGSNIVLIGFGLPYRGGELRPEAGMVATFHVREKREPTDDDIPIPPEVSVRLKRGHHFVAVTMPTDVVTASMFEPTGRYSTYTNDRPDDFTSGVVVSWRVRGEVEVTTAIVTVRHAFERGGEVAPLGSEVRIKFRQTGSGDTFLGRLYWRSRVGSSVDAAVITVTRQDLITARILPSGGAAVVREPRTRLQIVGDLGARGRSLRPGSSPRFIVQDIFPRHFDQQSTGLGPLRGVIITLADDRRTFEPTTSGSAWVIDSPSTPRPDAALQVGATAASDYRKGAGQALFLVLRAVKDVILSDESVARDSFAFLTSF